MFQDIFRVLIVKLCIQATNWPSQTLFRVKTRRIALKGSLLEHAPKQSGFFFCCQYKVGNESELSLIGIQVAVLLQSPPGSHG